MRFHCSLALPATADHLHQGGRPSWLSDLSWYRSVVLLHSSHVRSQLVLWVISSVAHPHRRQPNRTAMTAEFSYPVFYNYPPYFTYVPPGGHLAACRGLPCALCLPGTLPCSDTLPRLRAAPRCLPRSLQPMRETQQKQRQLWKDLILRFCKHHKVGCPLL